MHSSEHIHTLNHTLTTVIGMCISLDFISFIPTGVQGVRIQWQRCKSISMTPLQVMQGNGIPLDVHAYFLLRSLRNTLKDTVYIACFPFFYTSPSPQYIYILHMCFVRIMTWRGCSHKGKRYTFRKYAFFVCTPGPLGQRLGQVH